MNKINIILITIISLASFTACDLTLPVDDPQLIPIEEGFESLESIDQTLLSNYGIIRAGNTLGGNSNWMGSLLAEQAGRDASSGFGDVQFINVNFNAQNPILRPFWADLYVVANRASLSIDAVGDLEGSQDDKDRIQGESYFLRALVHFELVRYFSLPYIRGVENTQAGIPLRITPVLAIGAENVGRGTVEGTYEQIIDDLLLAIDLLPLQNIQEEGRPSSWAAKALLAKVYFQQNDFEDAFMMADDVITNGGFSLNPTVTDIFDPAQNFSSESIWELPSIVENNSSASLTGLYQSDRVFDPTYYSDPSFAAFATSDANDTRATSWYNTRLRNGDNPPPEPVTYVSKYDLVAFNLPLLRLADILLIRAESAAETSELAIAQADLQAVRGRAFQDEGTVIDFNGPQDLIVQIRDERAKEMAFEFSNIFHDLKRIGGRGETSTLIGDLPFNSPQLLFKIPDVEVNTNLLVSQNP